MGSFHLNTSHTSNTSYKLNLNTIWDAQGNLPLTLLYRFTERRHHLEYVVGLESASK